MRIPDRLSGWAACEAPGMTETPKRRTERMTPEQRAEIRAVIAAWPPLTEVQRAQVAASVRQQCVERCDLRRLNSDYVADGFRRSSKMAPDLRTPWCQTTAMPLIFGCQATHRSPS